MINSGNDEMQKEALIRSLGVFELRGLARELGVPSPTTKKRDELITLILNQIKEKNSVDITSRRRGRPFKKLTSLNEIVGTMLTDNRRYEIEDYDSVISFMQDDRPIIREVSENAQIFEGIVKASKDSFSISDNKQNIRVFIEPPLDGYEYLEVGAPVKVEAKQINESNMYFANRILQINKQNISDYKHSKYDKGAEIISDISIPFAKGSAKVGRRNIFSYKEDLYENKNFEKLYNFCKENNFELIVFGVNTSYENQIMIRNLGIENNFSTEYGTRNSINTSKIIDVINFTLYLLEQGKKVVVFIQDILEILRRLDEYFPVEEENATEHSQQTLLIIQKLLALGRAYESGCSSTLIIGYNEMDKDDKFLNNDIVKISKKIY